MHREGERGVSSRRRWLGNKHEEGRELRPPPHGEERAEENVIRGILLSRILTVCGQFLLWN